MLNIYTAAQFSTGTPLSDRVPMEKRVVHQEVYCEYKSMSGKPSSRNNALLAAAAGAGVLIGAAGLLVYSILEKKKVDSRRPTFRARQNSTCSSYFSCETTSHDDRDEDFFECFSDEDTLERERCDKKSEEELFERVDVLMKGDEEDILKAFMLLKDNECKMSENANFLWRFAKACQMQALAFGARENIEEKKKYISEGLHHASKALSLDENNPDAHKWFAILKGMQTDFLPIKEKIQSAFVFYEHILIAIKAKPQDYSLYHLLGRFKYELTKTSWTARKLAAAMFQELPSFTVPDAIADLLKAEELSPMPWKENKLLLAKCHIDSGDYKLALDIIEDMKGITPKTEEDRALDKEANFLFEKYKKYGR